MEITGKEAARNAHHERILPWVVRGNNGQDRIRTCEGVSQRIYSPPVYRENSTVVAIECQ